MAECCVHDETVKETVKAGVPYLMQLYCVMKEDWFKFRKTCLKDRYLIYIAIKIVVQDSL